MVPCYTCNEVIPLWANRRKLMRNIRGWFGIIRTMGLATIFSLVSPSAFAVTSVKMLIGDPRLAAAMQTLLNARGQKTPTTVSSDKGATRKPMSAMALPDPLVIEFNNMDWLTRKVIPIVAAKIVSRQELICNGMECHLENRQGPLLNNRSFFPRTISVGNSGVQPCISLPATETIYMMRIRNLKVTLPVIGPEATRMKFLAGSRVGISMNLPGAVVTGNLRLEWSPCGIANTATGIAATVGLGTVTDRLDSVSIGFEARGLSLNLNGRIGKERDAIQVTSIDSSKLDVSATTFSIGQIKSDNAAASAILNLADGGLQLFGRLGFPLCGKDLRACIAQKLAENMPDVADDSTKAIKDGLNKGLANIQTAFSQPGYSVSLLDFSTTHRGALSTRWAMSIDEVQNPDPCGSRLRPPGQHSSSNSNLLAAKISQGPARGDAPYDFGIYLPKSIQDWAMYTVAKKYLFTSSGFCQLYAIPSLPAPLDGATLSTAPNGAIGLSMLSRQHDTVFEFQVPQTITLSTGLGAISYSAALNARAALRSDCREGVFMDLLDGKIKNVQGAANHRDVGKIANKLFQDLPAVRIAPIEYTILDQTYPLKLRLTEHQFLNDVNYTRIKLSVLNQSDDNWECKFPVAEDQSCRPGTALRWVSENSLSGGEQVSFYTCESTYAPRMVRRGSCLCPGQEGYLAPQPLDAQQALQQSLQDNLGNEVSGFDAYATDQQAAASAQYNEHYPGAQDPFSCGGQTPVRDPEWDRMMGQCESFSPAYDFELAVFDGVHACPATGAERVCAFRVPCPTDGHPMAQSDDGATNASVPNIRTANNACMSACSQALRQICGRPDPAVCAQRCQASVAQFAQPENAAFDSARCLQSCQLGVQLTTQQSCMQSGIQISTQVCGTSCAQAASTVVGVLSNTTAHVSGSRGCEVCTYRKGQLNESLCSILKYEDNACTLLEGGTQDEEAHVSFLRLPGRDLCRIRITP